MLISLNKCKIINFINKTTCSEEFDEVHKVVLDGIIINMASLVNNDKYGAINAEDPTIMGYYILNCISEPFTIQ